MKTKRLILMIVLIVQSMSAMSSEKTVTIAEGELFAYEALSQINKQCEMDVDERTLLDPKHKVSIALDEVDCNVALNLLYRVTELKNQDANSGV